MQIKYRFLARARLEEHVEAEKLIEKLPPDHREVLNLMHDGMSQAKIAEAMGMKKHGARIYAAELKQIYIRVIGNNIVAPRKNYALGLFDCTVHGFIGTYLREVE